MSMLFIVPFTKTLIIAVGEEDAREVTNKSLQYIADIVIKDLIINNNRVQLKRPYMGQKQVILTNRAREVLLCSQ